MFSRKARKFHHIFGMIICLIGNIIQLYWISSQYFRYDISTNVQLLTPEKIDLPSVTICFELVRVIKWAALSREERVSLLTMDGASIFEQLNPEENITIRDIQMAVLHSGVFERSFLMSRLQTMYNTSSIFRITLSDKDLFMISFLYNPLKKNMDAANENLNIRTFIRDIQKCYLMQVIPSWVTNLSYSAIRKQSIYSKNYLASYWFKDEATWSLLDANYILSPVGHSSRLDNNAFLKLPINVKLLYALTYNEYRSQLLPPPYATMCRNYAKEGFMSKAGCYETCLRRLSLKTMKGLHPSLAIFPNETEKTARFLNMFADKLITSNLDIAQEVDNACTEECSKRDCSTVLYSPRYLTNGKDPPAIAPGSTTTISQLVSLTPVIKADCLEQISLIQYLTDIASSLGFWLGMSALATTSFFVYVLGGCRRTSHLSGHRSFLGWKTHHRGSRRRRKRSVDHLKQRLCEMDRWMREKVNLLERDKDLLFQLLSELIK